MKKRPVAWMVEYQYRSYVSKRWRRMQKRFDTRSQARFEVKDRRAQGFVDVRGPVPLVERDAP